MKDIIIKSQADWDNLPDKQNLDFNSCLLIYADVRIIFTGTMKAHLVTWGSSQAHLETWGSSQAHLVTRESSQAHLVTRESSQAHLETWESSQAHLVTWESSQAHLVTRGSSQAHLVTRGSSQAHLVTRGSSQAHLETRGSSQAHLETWESSQAELSAFTQGSLHLRGDNISALLFGLAVAYVYAKAKVIKKSDTAIIINVPPPAWTVEGYADREGLVIDEEKIVLFKRVSKDFKTQEGETNETLWPVGQMVVHPAWNPTSGECGAGKFHACSRPYLCDRFRTTKGDRYVAIQVQTTDIHPWANPEYLNKIAFKQGLVLYECDKYGKKI